MKLSMKSGLVPAAVAVAMGLSLSVQAEDVSDRLIIKYKQHVNLKNKSGFNAMNSMAARTAESMQHRRFMHNGAQVVKLNRKQNRKQLARLMAQIAADPDVAFVEIDAIKKPFATANDEFYNLQWHYHEATGGINLEDAWDQATGAGVNVAVLDTGYRPHVDLAANIIGGYDMINDTFVANDGNGRDSDALDPGDWVTFNECGGFNSAQDSSWHGTHVAGTVAAVTNNNIGVAGVAYNSKVVPVRVLGKCGGYTSDIVDGIVWASGGSVSGVPGNPNPAKVINMSLGGSGACSQSEIDAINTAKANGAVVVVAAGNSNANSSNYSPGNCPGVINVAATGRQGERASYSNYGSNIDVAAPGGNGNDGIASTLNDGAQGPGSDIYVYYQGTSMAAPHVAGVAALMFEANPNATPDEIEQALKDSARAFPSGSSCNTSNCGDGIVDAAAAIAEIDGGTPPTNQAPNASFTFSCADLSCSFDGSGSNDPDGSIASYAWSFGGSGATTNHTFGSAGTYAVTLTLTDNDGATDNATQQVTVTDGGTGPAPIDLYFDGFTRKGFLKVRWSGANGSRVDIYRDGTKIKTTRNDGKWNDKNVTAGVTYTYQICERNSTTVCSDEESVTP
ncbi:S8 family serine peptidase [Kangiella sp. TOML190]|uniref:S8 family serine peptidase n=1 Tax=Kangiella sp. TOML190 TaxID=2931351 RepID=UPI00203E429D|nr:S8 family serine peptidase [Kangiella sp. TOML190]